MKHHVLWDEDCRNHRRYGIRTWPIAFLIGKDGRVMWEGRPSKAVVPSGEQKLVDRTTAMVLERLVAQALKEPIQGEIAWKEKEARP